MSNRLVYPPPSELLSVADVQKHSRIDSDSEAEWAVASLLPVAIDEVQTYCNVQLLPATREETLTAFPRGRCPLQLPYRPLHSIVSIKYRATDGTLATWDAAEYEAERDGERFERRAGPAEVTDDGVREEHPERHHVAVGKVRELQDAEGERQAHRAEANDRTHDDADDDQLQQVHQLTPSVRPRNMRPMSSFASIVSARSSSATAPATST